MPRNLDEVEALAEDRARFGRGRGRLSFDGRGEAEAVEGGWKPGWSLTEMVTTSHLPIQNDLSPPLLLGKALNLNVFRPFGT